MDRTSETAQPRVDFSHYLPLAEVARRLPSSRAGRRLHVSCVLRWVHEGKLPAVRVGRCYFVHPNDLVAFVERVEPLVEAAPMLGPNARQREAQRQWTEEVLRREGVIR